MSFRTGRRLASTKVSRLIANRNKFTKLERNTGGWTSGRGGQVEKIIRASEESWQLYNVSIVSAPVRRRAEDRIRAGRIPPESIEPLRLVSLTIFHRRTFCSMHVVGALNSGNRFLEYFPPSCSKR